jgi:hypothetical protein
MFTGSLPDSIDDRWSLLEDVIARWFGASQVAGCPEEELAQCEARLGVRLPTALRVWYARWGARRDVWSLQDKFQLLSDLRMDQDILVFCVENQGVVRWGLERQDLDLEDPPVQVSKPADSKFWLAQSDTTSAFALQFAALNAKWSDFPQFHADFDLSDEVAAAIDKTFERLPFPKLHFPPFPTRLYGHDNLIVELQANAWIWITALTAAAFEEVQEIVRCAG